MDIEKANRRERIQRKRRTGMQVDNSGIRLLEEIKRKKGEEARKEKGKITGALAEN